MNEDTLKALKGSIKKWEKIISGEGVDKGDRNCPLCKLFNDACGIALDRDCPLVEKSQDYYGCRGTPYVKWGNHQIDVHHMSSVSIIREGFKLSPDCPECKRLAEAELEFLRSLLPQEKPSRSE